MKTTTLRLLSLCLLPTVLCLPAPAADVYWGGGTGAITDNNWYADATLTTATTRANADAIWLASGTLYITDNAIVNDTNIGSGAAGSSAAVVVSGTWNNTAGELSIGDALGSMGSLTILSGSVGASTFYVGNYGSGTFYIAQGATFTNRANAFFARNVGGSGVATIDGTWTIKGNAAGNGYLAVGSAAGSTGNLLNIGPTGKVTIDTNPIGDNYLRVAVNANTSGTINIAQGGALIVNAGVASGATAGSGTVNSIISIGHGSGALGVVNVSGLLSMVNSATAGDRSFAVGYGAGSDTAPAVGVLNIYQTGTVLLSNAGELSIGRMGVGSASSPFTTYKISSSGTVNVWGLLDTGGAQLLVGRSGDGYLNIYEGGTVLAGNTRVSNGNTQNGISYAEVNIAGNLNITGWFDIAGTGNGYVKIAPTGVVTTTADFAVGRSTSSNSGTRNSGSIDVYGYLRAGGVLNVANDGAGTFNLYDGGLAVANANANIALTAQSIGVLNLYGGVFQASTITRGAGNATINFRGGTIRASANTASFFVNFPTIDLAAGSLTFDTQAFNVTATNVLAGASAATLNKTGAGKLILTANSSAFAGTTNIRAGILASGNDAARLGGAINILSGATIDTRAASLAVNNLTLADGAIWAYSIDTRKQLAAANLNVSGAGTLYLDLGALNLTTLQSSLPAAYTLGTYTTASGLSNFANWTLAGGTIAYGGAIDTTSTPGSIKLNLNSAGVNFLYWQGGNGNWDTASTTWKLAGSPSKWLAGSLGIFDTTPGAVTVTGIQTFNTLQFDINGFILNGPGSLAANTLGGNGVANFNVTAASATATINATVLASGIYKTGPGNLILNGPVNGLEYGAITVDGGKLAITNTASLIVTNVATGIALAGGGTLSIGGILENRVAAPTLVDSGAIGTLEILSGGRWNVLAGTTILGNSGEGHIILRDGSVANLAGRLTIGGAGAQTSTITIEQNALLNYTAASGGNFVLGNATAASSAAGIAHISGTILKINTLYIGETASGNSTLNLYSGGYMATVANSWIGRNSGVGTNTMNINGYLYTGGYFRHEYGTAILNIGPTGFLDVNDYSSLAHTAGVNASAYVQGTWRMNNYLYIGNAGNATLTVGSGGLIDVGTNIRIGSTGTGTLEILSGGTVIQRGANNYVASDVGAATSKGTLIIRSGGFLDSGTRNSTGDANFGIGWAGTGTMLIETGGTAISSGAGGETIAFSLGDNATGKGAATVAGYLAANNGYAAIGFSGTGALEIVSGGYVVADRVSIAKDATASGTLVLSGGVLETRQLSYGLGTAAIIYNGGTIRAAAAAVTNNFFSNIPTLNLAAGSFTLDTQALAITATNALAGTSAAKLDKIGAGNLILTANSSAYAGAINIRAGALDLGPTAIVGGNVNIGSGASIRPTTAGATVTNLTINSAGALDLRYAPLAAASLTLDNGAIWRYSLTDEHLINITGALTAAGAGTFFLDRGSLPIGDVPGSYTLATFGSLSGNFDSWTIATSDFSFTGTWAIDTLSVPGTLKINLLTADADLLTWQTGNGPWDATSTTWKRFGTPVTWNNGALALFNAGSGTVGVTGLHTVFALQFGDLATDAAYTLAGTGTITAVSVLGINTVTPSSTATINTALIAPSLTKDGPGALVLGGPATFSGRASIGAGSLVIAPAGVLNAAGVDIATIAGNTATATVAGTLANTADLNVGAAGAGALIVKSGAIVNQGANAIVGGAAGASGLIKVESGGAYNQTAGYLRLAGAAGASGTLIIENGGVASVSTDLSIGDAGAGALIIKSGAIVNQRANAIIGNATGASGLLKVETGGTYNQTTGYLRVAGATGASGTLIIENAAYATIASAVHIGSYGTGTALINGRLNTPDSLYIGVYAGGNGAATIGQTGIVTATANLSLGYSTGASGTLAVAGLANAGGALYLGYGAGSTGNLLDIAPTGTVKAAGVANIGNAANSNGTVNVAGVLDIAGISSLGNAAGALGIINVNTGGYYSSGTNAIRLGAVASGSGILNIAPGATVRAAGVNVSMNNSYGELHIAPGGALYATVNTVYVGGNAGAANAASYGIATIDGFFQSGTNSSGLPGTYYFPVGYSGTGILTIGSTGTVFAGQLDIGREATGTGTVTIAGLYKARGDNSSLVGNAGKGTLVIKNGGILDNTAQTLTIGNAATGIGDMTIETGGNVTTGNLNVGNNGVGALTLAPGGKLTITGQYRQNPASTLVVTYNPAQTTPYITASTASLSGTLVLAGASLNYTPVAKSSELTNRGVLVLTATSGLISGNFNSFTGLSTTGLPDYIAPGGSVKKDPATGAASYYAGYALAWNSPANAHGTFTIPSGQTFEIDTPLANRYGELAPGWDGKSLTKNGPGTLVLSAQNTFTGALAINDGTLRLDGPATHACGPLLNNATLDFGPPASSPSALQPFSPSAFSFRTLQAASLSGNGTYLMTVDPAAGAGDKLIVLGDATGNHQLLLTLAPGAAAPAPGDPPTTLATIAGANNATFTGGLDYNGVNYAIHPATPGAIILGAAGASGVLDPIRGIPGSQSLLWFASQDNLTRRLGELRAPDTPPAGTSLWLRARAERDNIDGAATNMLPFHMTLYGAELGADKTLAPADSCSRLTTGLYLGYGHATQDFTLRPNTGSADAKSDQLSAGLYAAWLRTTGLFANLTLTAAYYKNTLTTADQSANPTTGNNHDTAYGASLEFGKRLALGATTPTRNSELGTRNSGGEAAAGWFLEPSAQATLARLTRGDYTTTGANNLAITGDPATLTRLRALIRAGRSWQTPAAGWMEIAARVGAMHEASSGGEIRAGSNTWTPNLDGNRFETGASIYWRPKSNYGQFYLDYEYVTGAGLQKPWSLSLGFRLSL